MRTLGFLGSFVAALLMFSFAAAEVVGPTDNVYFPGYVPWYPTTLALFVPAELHPACEALQKGDLAAAEKDFAEAIRKNPNSLAAHLGFLQAIRGKRKALLPRYQQDLEKRGTAADQFKLGVLTLYLLGERYQDYSEAGQAEKKKLADLTRYHLEEAYKKSHAPVVAFTLAGAYAYVGGGKAQDLYEDMFRRLGGEETYQVYLRAKKNGWQGPQPPVPKLSRNDLLIYRYAVGEIWSMHSSRTGKIETRIVNGKQQFIDKGEYYPRTKQQLQAMAYLEEWRKRIKSVADAEKP